MLGLAPGRRGHAPGDAPRGLARARRVRGARLPAHLALPDRHEPLPQPPARQGAAARRGPAADARAAPADAPCRAAVAPALPGRPARGPARRRAGAGGAVRDEGGDRARVRRRAAAAAAAAAHRARAARRPRLLGRRERGDAGDDGGVGEGRAPARARGARRATGRRRARAGPGLAAGAPDRRPLRGRRRARRHGSGRRPARRRRLGDDAAVPVRVPGQGGDRPLPRRPGAAARRTAARRPDPRQRPARLRLLPRRRGRTGSWCSPSPASGSRRSRSSATRAASSRFGLPPTLSRRSAVALRFGAPGGTGSLRRRAG